MEEESLVEVEVDGDPDLFIASRDFSRLADAQQKVGAFVYGMQNCIGADNHSKASIFMHCI